MGRLTDTSIKAAKAKDTQYTLSDGNGLSLLISTNGNKTWRARFTLNGKPMLRGLGSYPETSLAQARESNLDYRRCAAQGKDKKHLKQVEQKKAEQTFKKISKEWYQNDSINWVPKGGVKNFV